MINTKIDLFILNNSLLTCNNFNLTYNFNWLDYNIFPIIFNSNEVLALANNFNSKIQNLPSYITIHTLNMQEYLQSINFKLQQSMLKAMEFLQQHLSLNHQDNQHLCLEFLKNLIYYGVTQQITDIHLDISYRDYILRYRHLNTLNLIGSISYEAGAQLVNRCKILAKLDISNPQGISSGSFMCLVTSPTQNYRVMVRVSTHPGFYGQHLAIRLIYVDFFNKNLSNLGFDNNQIQQLHQLIQNKQGLIIFAGPTGSGKTTSMYTLLNTLNCQNYKICTLEDPVEFINPGWLQTDLSILKNLTPQDALASFLRQDVDILLIGEVRTEVAAKYMERAANTGHLVLTSLHASSYEEAFNRLNNLGVNLDLCNLKAMIFQKLETFNKKLKLNAKIVIKN